MPAEFVRYGERWRALHPAWDCRDWDAPLQPLVNQALYDAPAPAHVHRCRADVMRLEVLWRFGGVYVDTDIEPVRALDGLLAQVQAAGASAFIAWSSNRWHGRRLVSNAAIGAEPGHPFIRRAMAGLPVSVRKYWNRFLALMTVHYLTSLLGPLKAGVSGEGVLVLPETSFFPQSIAAQRAGHPVRVTPRTYGIHHWAHSRGLR